MVEKVTIDGDLGTVHVPGTDIEPGECIRARYIPWQSFPQKKDVGNNLGAFLLESV
jgi:hypothetical protein